MRVRIGVANATRELDLDVDDAEEVAAGYERALENGDSLYWVTESDGKKFGVVVAAVLYVEFEPDKRLSIGFSPE